MPFFLLGVLLGALLASIVCGVLWEDFQFRWTIKHGLRVDLFSMSPSEVREELRRVAGLKPQDSGSSK